MSYNTGISATLVLSGGAAFTARWRSISGLRRFVEQLDDTALDSLDFMESVPDDLLESDPLDCELYFDGTKEPPVGDVGSILLTLPLQSGQTTPLIVSGSGYITSDQMPELAAGQRLMRTVQIKFDGKTGPAVTLAT